MTSQKQDRPSNTASMLHSIAEELGCAPELVGVVKKELKLRKRDDIKHAVQERLAAQADDAPSETPATDESETPKPKKERKASLTLSQRRALLRLLDSEDGVAPATDFKALPFEHLVEVGYAEKGEASESEPCGRYVLTAKGTTRAQEINPGYRVWSAGESVAGDENRPPAGTHRQTKAEQEAAKAAAEAEAAKANADAEQESDAEPVAIEA